MDELTQIGIEKGFLDSPTQITAREKFEAALKAIHEGESMDAGMGFGAWNFWVKMNGVEYIVDIKPTTLSDSE